MNQRVNFDAVILAGGRGERLGGLDKASITVGSATMLDRALAAAIDASRIICVGPERPARDMVVWTREDPPGGGPVAAVDAGLQLVETPVVVVLAVDLPFVSEGLVLRLVDLCDAADAAVVTDADEIPQPLLAAYRVSRLRAVLESLLTVEGASMMQILDPMKVVTLSDPEAARDCDTPEDLERARAET